MQYLELLKQIEIAVAKKLGNEYVVSQVTACKTNDQISHGISILKKGEKISVIIYLEKYKQLKFSMDDIVEDIIYIYFEAIIKRPVEGCEELLDWNHVKGRIRARVVNTDQNKQYLEKGIPSLSKLDLSIIFYIVVGEDLNCATYTTNITNVHLEHWGKGVEEIYDLACKNSLKDLEIFAIGEHIKEFGCSEVDSIKITKQEMYVFTNRTKTNGAISVLLPDVLKKFALKMEDNLLVLPSSTHEMIVFCESRYADYQMLKRMVTEVNNDYVSEGEILSDKVYRYDKEKDILEIVAYREERGWLS